MSTASPLPAARPLGPRAALALPPTAQYRRYPAFYMVYDGIWAALCGVVLVGLAAVDHAPLLTTWTWVPFLLPVACYVQILASVFVHNATHQSFPKRINRLVGELCGAVILTRYASWEIIHQRHHRHSDDPARDPHPLRPGYWDFLVRTVVNVERMLQAMYFERWGDTPENRRYERRRAWVSYATNLLLVAAWYQLLGPIAFFGLFVPASIVGFLHLVHFNWTTHDAHNPRGEFGPINQDRGLLWLGNRIWFGIYMHKNHHDRPGVFNPLRMGR